MCVYNCVAEIPSSGHFPRIPLYVKTSFAFKTNTFNMSRSLTPGSVCFPYLFLSDEFDQMDAQAPMNQFSARKGNLAQRRRDRVSITLKVRLSTIFYKAHTT